MQFGKYLEERGIKYLAALVTIFYVCGTIIFNIFLGSLGIFEFDLKQLRFVFIGFLFSISLGIFAGIFWAARILWLKIFKKKLNKKQRKIFLQKFEIGFFLFSFFWLIFYALKIFPQIPSGFGGGKPILARLYGDAEKIIHINEIIAREVGVAAAELPFEFMNEKSTLAIGANVKILDQNRDRFLLILPRDLYLKSTSNLAKNLLDANENLKIENLKLKPLIVKADKIEGISTNLFVPPQILTTADLKIAAEIISKNPDLSPQIFQNLKKKEPEISPKILAAVEKISQKNIKKISEKNAENKKNWPEKNLEKNKNSEKIAEKNSEKIAEQNVENKKNLSEKNLENLEKNSEKISQKNSAAEIEKILVENFDQKFLDFRSQIFSAALKLAADEKFGRAATNARLELVREISANLRENFPESWTNLAEKNFLILGQSEENFPKKIAEIFRGAESADVIISRFNENIPAPKNSDDFAEIRDGALEILRKSSQENSAANRKFLSRLLIKFFAGKARRKVEFWSDTKYISAGRDDENFLKNIFFALENSVSWQNFGENLQKFQKNFEQFSGSGAAAE